MIPIALVLVLAGYYMVAPGSVTVKANEQLISLDVDVIADVLATPSIGEILADRTLTTKHHYLGGDSYALDASISPIHYQDGYGDWQNINTELQLADPGDEYDWYMVESNYQLIINNAFNEGQVIHFIKDGEQVSLQPMALQWTNQLDQIDEISMPQNVTPAVSSETAKLVGDCDTTQGLIRWDNAYGGGIDFQWKATTTKLEKIIEISSLSDLPEPEQYILDGGNATLRYSLIFSPSKNLSIEVDGSLWDKKTKVQTFDYIEFKKDTNTLFGFAPLYYWDSSDNIGQSIATLDKKGNDLYISINVPYEWLQSATFPVFVDATLEDQVGHSYDDAQQITAGTMIHHFTVIDIGYYTQPRHSGVRFPDISGLAGVTIDTANTYISFYAYTGDTGDFVGDWYAEDAESPPQFGAEDFYIDDLTKTTATCEGDGEDFGNWSGSTWYDFYGNGTNTIGDIIQELANDYDPDAIVLVHIYDSGSGERRFVSYDGSSTDCAKIHIEYSSGCTPDISNSPSSKNFGTVGTSQQLWSNGTPPTFPLDDGECYFTVTNNSGGQIDIQIKATNFTGGNGWTLSSSPGADIVTLKAGKSGDANEGAMVTLTTSYQDFILDLADSATKKWELHLETATSHSDGATKTSTVTLSATCD